MEELNNYINANEALEALLYDWHNNIKLRRQNEDIAFFQSLLKQLFIKEVLVVGAGTGRIAIPLNETCNVDALDINQGRLNRLERKTSSVNIICCDIAEYYTTKKYDCVIVPYSTFQCIYPTEKIIGMLKVIHEQLSYDGFLLIDLSTHFNEDVDEDWTLVAEGYSQEIGKKIKELQRTIRHQQYIDLNKLFQIDGEELKVLVNEIWYNYDAEYMKKVLSVTGFSIIEIRNGYGNEKSTHRRIYICKRV